MKAILFSIFLSLPILIFGQSNYYKGYIVKNTGDTIKGYINYLDWIYSPKAIDFKTDIVNKETIKYTALDIQSFQINGYEEYLSFRGLISVNKNIFPNYPTSLDTNRELSAIFLKKLINGKNVSLYFNNENDKNRFFVAEANGQPVELKYYPYYLEESNNVKYNNLFVGQLMLLFNKYFSGNENMFNKFQDIQYDQKDIEKVIIQINGGAYTIHSKKATLEDTLKKRYRFFIGAGLNYNNTKYVPNNYFNVISTSTRPKIEFGTDIFTNPAIQNIIIRGEVSLYYIDVKYIEEGIGVNFNQIVGSFTPQIIYNLYYSPNFRFYIDAGFRFNFSSTQNLTYIHVNQGRKIVNPEEIQLYGNSAITNYNWGSFPFQAGFLFKNRLEVYFSYTAYKQVNNDFSFQTMNLGVKYMLKRYSK
jgi:hypothetical protein